MKISSVSACLVWFTSYNMHLPQRDSPPVTSPFWPAAVEAKHLTRVIPQTSITSQIPVSSHHPCFPAQSLKCIPSLLLKGVSPRECGQSKPWQTVIPKGPSPLWFQLQLSLWKDGQAPCFGPAALFSSTHPEYQANCSVRRSMYINNENTAFFKTGSAFQSQHLQLVCLLYYSMS